MRFAASAPGKAVLSGEYAVLHGAPAIAMAVDCRARVSAESTDADCHSVVSPGFREQSARFRCCERGVIDWLDDVGPRAEHALLENVWRRLRAMPSRQVALTLDTRRFFDPESSMKLGFGSSAALAVALTAALIRSGAAEPEAGPEADVLESAVMAHRDFQGGRGSGIDIAAAMRGGLIGFRTRPEFQIESLKWPEGLRYSLLWSGKPASTAERLKAVKRVERTRAARRAAGRLMEASGQVANAWRAGVDTAVLEALQAYTDVLRQFSSAHMLGIFDAGHQELCDIAAAQGFVYKPCGAGGGDIGIVLAPRGTPDSALIGFGSQAGSSGFRRLDQSLETAGLIYEH